MPRDFRWNDWNRDHATRHGVSVGEIERVMRNGRPRFVGDGKYHVVGRGAGGRWVQAIYIVSPAEYYYPIHARPLSDTEKRRGKKRK